MTSRRTSPIIEEYRGRCGTHLDAWPLAGGLRGSIPLPPGRAVPTAVLDGEDVAWEEAMAAIDELLGECPAEHFAVWSRRGDDGLACASGAARQVVRALLAAEEEAEVALLDREGGLLLDVQRRSPAVVAEITIDAWGAAVERVRNLRRSRPWLEERSGLQPGSAWQAEAPDHAEPPPDAGTGSLRSWRVERSDPSGRVLLLVQSALLGRIPPSLRSIDVVLSADVIELACSFDETASAADRALVEAAAREVEQRAGLHVRLRPGSSGERGAVLPAFRRWEPASR